MSVNDFPQLHIFTNDHAACHSTGDNAKLCHCIETTENLFSIFRNGRRTYSRSPIFHTGPLSEKSLPQLLQLCLRVIKMRPVLKIEVYRHFNQDSEINNYLYIQGIKMVTVDQCIYTLVFIKKCQKLSGRHPCYNLDHEGPEVRKQQKHL